MDFAGIGADLAAGGSGLEALGDARGGGFIVQPVAVGIDEFGLVDDAVDFLVRAHEFEEGAQALGAGQFLGSVLLIGGVAGVLAGGVLGDRLGGSDKAMYARVPAISYWIGAPLFIAGVLSSSVSAAFILFVIPQALVYVWLGPVLTAVQHLVPAPMRATASATFLLINNLIGLGLGSWLVGALSDGLTPAYGNEALRYAVAAALCLYVLAGILMWLGGKALRTAWVD